MHTNRFMQMEREDSKDTKSHFFVSVITRRWNYRFQLNDRAQRFHGEGGEFDNTDTHHFFEFPPLARGGKK